MLRCYPVLSLTLLSLTFVANASQPQPPARDLHGDPLPPGAVARLGMARWLQGTIADFAEFLPDGKTVVTVSDDRTVCLWEFPSGRELHRFSLPAGPAKVPDPKKMAERNYARAALSKDGKVIAVGYLHEPEIYLHETATGKKLPGLTSALTTGIDALAFSPSGDNLAAAEGDGAIRIWDWARAKEIRTLTVGVQPYNPGFDKLPLAYAPDGKSIATGQIGKLDKKALVKLWDTATGAEIWTVRPASIERIEALVLRHTAILG